MLIRGGRHCFSALSEHVTRPARGSHDPLERRAVARLAQGIGTDDAYRALGQVVDHLREAPQAVAEAILQFCQGD